MIDRLMKTEIWNDMGEKDYKFILELYRYIDPKNILTHQRQLEEIEETLYEIIENYQIKHSMATTSFFEALEKGMFKRT